jgi:predicted nucleotidyltransferase
MWLNYSQNRGLFIMDKATAVEYARQYATEVTKVLKPEAIIMFGSCAADKASEDSDIDVAVIFNGFEGDFLKISAWLWSLTWQVSSHIEPVLLDRSLDNSGFVEEVIRTGELIYQH